MTQIEGEMPQAVQLLTFLAYLDHHDIRYDLLCVSKDLDWPQWFCQLTSDQFRFMEAMALLTRYYLVETYHDTNSYSLHTCMHDWTLDGLNRVIDGGLYWLAFDCVAKHIESEDWDDLSQIKYQRFTSHAMRLVHDRFQIAADQLDSLRSRFTQIDNLAQLLKEQMQYNAAEKLYLRALVGKERVLDANHSSTLETVHNLGILMRNLGRPDQGRMYFRRALARHEKALGPHHVSTLNTIHHLGILFFNLGQLEQAEEYYQRALAGRERVLGQDLTSTLQTASNLGVLYKRQGKLDKAEAMYVWALAGREKALGPNHPLTLQIVNNLGNLHNDRGKLDEAEAMYQRALAGYEETLGTR